MLKELPQDSNEEKLNNMNIEAISIALRSRWSRRSRRFWAFLRSIPAQERNFEATVFFREKFYDTCGDP